jgi:hypothetical protein
MKAVLNKVDFHWAYDRYWISHGVLHDPRMNSTTTQNALPAVISLVFAIAMLALSIYRGLIYFMVTSPQYWSFLNFPTFWPALALTFIPRTGGFQARAFHSVTWTRQLRWPQV